MTASNTSEVDSLSEPSCSGVCCYGDYSSEASVCRCSSLDTSQEIPVYVFKVAKALQRVLQQNDAELQQAVNRPTCFHCARGPLISIRFYIQRIAKHSKCSPVCFIMAWSYLKRLAQSHPELAVTSLTVHRLVITAVMLAAKLTDDKYYNNAFYARIGGVTTSELNLMELEMLCMLNFRTFVSCSQLKELLGHLDALQVGGRLVSVLCGKRFIHTPSSSSAVPAIHVGVQKPKVTKSHIVTQHPRQPSQFGISSQNTVCQTVSDMHCKGAQLVSSTISKVDCALSADCGLVCGKSDLTPVSRLSSKCLDLTSVAIIDVSA